MLHLKDSDLTLSQIADEWARETGTDRCEKLARIVRGIWEGMFERDGASVLYRFTARAFDAQGRPLVDDGSFDVPEEPADAPMPKHEFDTSPERQVYGRGDLACLARCPADWEQLANTRLDEFCDGFIAAFVEPLRVTRKDFELAADAAGWGQPKFWFATEAEGAVTHLTEVSEGVDIYHTGAPGKPTVMHFTRPEFKRRRDAKKAMPKLIDEAEAILQWLTDEYPRAPRPTAKTIANHIRDLHQAAFPSTGYGQRR